MGSPYSAHPTRVTPLWNSIFDFDEDDDDDDNDDDDDDDDPSLKQH